MAKVDCHVSTKTAQPQTLENLVFVMHDFCKEYENTRRFNKWKVK